MQTPTSSGQGISARAEILQALAALDRAESTRRTARYQEPRPKLKPLVLKAAPDACVRRSAGTGYECFIGGKRITAKGCRGAHPTPDRAWLCLARYIAEGEAQ